MKKPSLISSGNLAFVIVVAASYLSAITAFVYSQRQVPTWQAIVLIGSAVAYLIVGTYGFALARRSRTRVTAVTYFFVQLSLAALLIRLPGHTGELSFILLPLAGQSALLLKLRWMIVICATIYVLLVMPLILVNRWIDAVAIALVYGTGIVFVVVFTRIAASEREARAELSQANRLLCENAAQVEELAVTQERNRLAREIHDNLGHYLTVVNVQIGAAQAVFRQDSERALHHLSKAQTLTQEGLTEVRRSVAALRASPIESRPLPEALAKLVTQWNTTRMTADLSIIGSVRPLSRQAELTLYRAAQEALTNVSKHARASQVNLVLNYASSESVLLQVRDNGRGSDGSEAGFGLLGVRERAQQLGGEVRIQRNAGGFELEVELPQ
ncbi:MAG TPA: sensor histidine kinase [Pyrinomonadaceae bacterium]|nr:sensor histidine kinase [Pyrinomonadaceae bacterium]